MMYTDREGDPPMRCVRCKKPDDVLIYRRFCQSPLHPPGRDFRVVVTSRTNYECYVCRHNGDYRGKKERRVVQFLAKAFPTRDPSLLNKIIGGNLSLKYRPDIYYDLGDRALIVEVDEFEHQGYPVSCESKRMAEITMTIGVPTIYVRFNPDRLTDVKIPYTQRIETLERELIRWFKRAEWPRFMEVQYLFYSPRREKQCQEAIESTLREVQHLHPELK